MLKNFTIRVGPTLMISAFVVLLRLDVGECREHLMERPRGSDIELTR